MRKAEKKPSAVTTAVRRLRRVPITEKVLEAFDYGLIVGIKVRKPNRRH
jgi:hypothetical protein